MEKREKGKGEIISLWIYHCYTIKGKPKLGYHKWIFNKSSPLYLIDLLLNVAWRGGIVSLKQLELGSCQVERGVTLVVSLPHISACQNHSSITSTSITNSWVGNMEMPQLGFILSSFTAGTKTTHIEDQNVKFIIGHFFFIQVLLLTSFEEQRHHGDVGGASCQVERCVPYGILLVRVCTILEQQPGGNSCWLLIFYWNMYIEYSLGIWLSNYSRWEVGTYAIDECGPCVHLCLIGLISSLLMNTCL